MQLTKKKRKKALRRYQLLRQVVGMTPSSGSANSYYLSDEHFYNTIAGFHCKSQLQWERDELDSRLLADSIKAHAYHVDVFHNLRSQALSGKEAKEYIKQDDLLKLDRFLTIIETFRGKITRDLVKRVFTNWTAKHIRDSLEERYPNFFVSPKYAGPAVLPDLLVTDHLAEQLDAQRLLLERLERGTTGTQTREQAGFVYIATSPAYPEWVKVGSTLNLRERLATFNIYSPFADFEFKHFQFFSDRLTAEASIHALLEEHQGEGEWFQVSLDRARNAIQEYLNEKDLEKVEKVVDDGSSYSYIEKTNAVQ